MQRISGWRRGTAAFVLGLSAAVALLLPIADARAEIASNTAQPHVEQPGSPGCPPAHDELTCQLCRVLRLATSGGSASPVLVLADVAQVASATQLVTLPATRVEPSASPRAPPVA